MTNMLLYSKDLYSPSLHQSWLLHLISLRSWKQQVSTIYRFILFYFLSLKVILYPWMLYYVYAVDISAGICWLTWLSCLLILTIISNEAWSTCWLDSRRPICWPIYIYIYIWVLLFHKIQEIYGYALFVWWITLIYLYDHICIHLIEVCIIVLKKKRKWQIMPKYIHFITCFLPDRPLHYGGLSHILKL